jgi:SAM-dependent methyltransferase
MSFFERLLERTGVYRSIQAPFAEQKLAPFLEDPDVRRARRVLDVGCGPGTNTRHFADQGYVGIDINPRYIEYARRRFGRTFIVADVTRYQIEDEEPFDLVLVNSFFHHINDENTDRILSHLATLIAEGGHLYVLDLILPANWSPARALAELDRGDHPRPFDQWKRLLGRHFEWGRFEPYPLGLGPLTLWYMFLAKGTPKAPIRRPGRG